MPETPWYPRQTAEEVSPPTATHRCVLAVSFKPLLHPNLLIGDGNSGKLSSYPGRVGRDGELLLAGKLQAMVARNESKVGTRNPSSGKAVTLENARRSQPFSKLEHSIQTAYSKYPLWLDLISS